jgi:hypothetical protein
VSVKIDLNGMNELRDALRKLPEDLATEASIIVSGWANRAQRDIQAGYPQGPTGNLKRGVRVTHNAGRRVTATSIVKSTAPHAWIFENGTARRVTNRGANRGRMPKPPVDEKMLPKVIRLRARMVEELIKLVERAGFTVSGA